jgi:polar amino acid transport system substrate-binding protein
MSKIKINLIFGIIAAIILSSWPNDLPQSQAQVPPSLSQKTILRVGITPNYPPMIFKWKGEITGLEADFALRLGKALHQDIQFIELPWVDQINALMEGKTDIIMSAMTITDARKVRINFTDPYLKSGLAAMMRAGDGAKYDSKKKILESMTTVGVIQGTTGEVFVRNQFLSHFVIPIKNPGEAPDLLTNRRIDLFVHDAPSILWLLSENETTLRGSRDLLNEDYLAWAIRFEDQALLKKINAVLADWKKDGTLKQIVLKWLPYWKIF